MNKIFSGRFIFTVISAVIFLIGSVMGTIHPDKVTEIIMLVIIFYFNRTDRKGEQQ